MESFETLTFLRGVSRHYDSKHPSVHHVRKDRRPKDVSPEFHAIADDWFNKKFGVRYRSQSLLVTSQELTAQNYAASAEHIMRIIPLCEYRYCWSPKISDLLFLSQRLESKNRSEIEDGLLSLDYREDGLIEAHAAGHEVMLFCENYIAVPVHLNPGNFDKKKPEISLVLPKTL